MIPIKTSSEIAQIKKGGAKLASVMKKTLASVKPGEKLINLDQLAENLIKKEGGEPSFKMVKNYHWATCINQNQGVVHGIPTDREIKAGDLLSLDIGMYYAGFHTDMARTVRVGKGIDVGEDVFLKAGKLALMEAIKAAYPGNRVGHISRAIERVVRKEGYSPIEALTGHGVGRRLHEAPQIPCLLRTPILKTATLKPGMVLAIEVIYSAGRPEIMIKKDGWTVETKDGSLAALFEDSVLITKKGGEVLTRLRV